MTKPRSAKRTTRKRSATANRNRKSQDKLIAALKLIVQILGLLLGIANR